ncbi:MAG: PQQ-binding-like beta-propeller repeat protein [Candidatus Sericytochromatia bacterium]
MEARRHTRRWRAALVLVVAALATNCGGSVPPAGPVGAPLSPEHADAVGNRLDNARALRGTGLTPQNIGQLSYAWGLSTDAPVSHFPLVEGSRVYTADWGGRVHCVDLKTGEPLWQKQVEQPNAAAPWHGFAGTGDLGGGRLYVASAEGRAFAIDPASGKVLWASRFTAQPDVGSIGRLRHYDGLVFIGLAPSREPEDGTPRFRGQVVALDAASGEVRWTRDLTEGEGTGVAVWGSFAVDPATDTLYVGTGNATSWPASPYSDAVLALDARTGAVRWARQLTAHDVVSPTMPVGLGYDVGAGPQLFLGTIGQAARRLVGAGQKSGVYTALDADTGEVVWQQAVGHGGAGGGLMAESSVGQGRIHLWSNNGYDFGADPAERPATVRALDAGTGAPIWVRNQIMPAGATSAGFLADDLYMVGALDGRVRAFDAQTGKRLWVSHPHGSVASSLVVAGDTLLFGTGVPSAFGGKPESGLIAYQLGGKGVLPTPTPSPTPTPTPTPSPTPSASPTPRPWAPASPSPSPEGDESPSPSPSPDDEESPSPSPSPSPDDAVDDE